MSFIDTQLFTPPTLLQATQDVTDSEDDTIIEDTPPASQDVTDSEDDITIEDTPASQDVTLRRFVCHVLGLNLQSG